MKNKKEKQVDSPKELMAFNIAIKKPDTDKVEVDTVYATDYPTQEEVDLMRSRANADQLVISLVGTFTPASAEVQNKYWWLSKKKEEEKEKADNGEDNQAGSLEQSNVREEN